MRLPFTISVIGTSPGPTPALPPAAVCASSSGEAAAVTALTTPADLRKSRRVTANPPGLSSLRAIANPLDETSGIALPIPVRPQLCRLLKGDYARLRERLRPEGRKKLCGLDALGHRHPAPAARTGVFGLRPDDAVRALLLQRVRDPSADPA